MPRQEELRGPRIAVQGGVVEQTVEPFGPDLVDLLDRAAESRRGGHGTLHLSEAEPELCAGHRPAQAVVQELQELDPLLVGQRFPFRPQVRRVRDPGIAFAIKSKTQGDSPQEPS